MQEQYIEYLKARDEEAKQFIKIQETGQLHELDAGDGDDLKSLMDAHQRDKQETTDMMQTDMVKREEFGMGRTGGEHPERGQTPRTGFLKRHKSTYEHAAGQSSLELPKYAMPGVESDRYSGASLVQHDTQCGKSTVAARVPRSSTNDIRLASLLMKTGQRVLNAGQKSMGLQNVAEMQSAGNQNVAIMADRSMQNVPVMQDHSAQHLISVRAKSI